MQDWIRSGRLTSCARALAAGAAIFYGNSLSAEITFDFETEDYASSPIVSGDIDNFPVSSGSLKFADPAPEPYENFTYDLPFDNFTSGIVSMWFYDTRGSYNTGHGVPKAGGSIILEDANNPQDFVALEVLSFPYGKQNIPAYYGSEGIVDRQKPNDRFDSSSLPWRTVGFHKVEFHVSDQQTLIYVDGVASTEVAGPGSTATLRLRVMVDSPSNGGSADNWVIAPRAVTWGVADEWLYFDDIEIQQELPTVQTHTNSFEIVNETPEFDSTGVPPSPGGPGNPPADNPHMNTFVNQWAVSTSATAARSGSQSAYFANAVPTLRSIVFDLDGVEAGTSATLYFYDALGQNVDFDKNNSIILENANDPSEFIAVEISNWPYPFSAPLKNYYLTEGIPGEPASGMFWSGSLPARSIGWHKVEIGFYPTHTLIALDDAVGHRNNPALLAQGPGVDKHLRLRLMADGATQGGSDNWTAVDELTALYQVSTDPYVLYDNITLPLPPEASVSDWQMY